MCDSGILDINPNLAKLEYCIVITPEIIKEMEDEISKLINEEVEVTCPIIGNCPEENESKNTIIIDTKKKHKFGTKEYGTSVVRFSLEELPGCCGILVSYHTTIYYERYQNKGINKFLQEIKEKIARKNGYSQLLATTISTNNVENHILETHGWIKTHEFKNSRTGNIVYEWVKDL